MLWCGGLERVTPQCLQWHNFIGCLGEIEKWNSGWNFSKITIIKTKLFLALFSTKINRFLEYLDTKSIIIYINIFYRKCSPYSSNSLKKFHKMKSKINSNPFFHDATTLSKKEVLLILGCLLFFWLFSHSFPLSFVCL